VKPPPRFVGWRRSRRSQSAVREYMASRNLIARRVELEAERPIYPRLVKKSGKLHERRTHARRV
jgi:hypothetical protein